MNRKLLTAEGYQRLQDELNDLGIAVVLSHIENGQGSNKVISVSPDVGTEYVQEGTNSVVTLYYD